MRALFPRPALELFLVFVTGALHLAFENVLHLKGPFIAAATILWTIYLVTRALKDPRVLRDWGFRTDTLNPAGLACGLAFIAGAAGMLAYAALRGSLAFPPRFWLLLTLCPVWGLLQQFLLNALVARNLAHWLPKALVIPLAALLFSLAHMPDLPLCGLTFAAGLCWVAIYLRWPNLWAPGLCHGLLGSLAYTLVLGRDVWAEVIKFLP